MLLLYTILRKKATVLTKLLLDSSAGRETGAGNILRKGDGGYYHLVIWGRSLSGCRFPPLPGVCVASGSGLLRAARNDGKGDGALLFLDGAYQDTLDEVFLDKGVD